MKKEAIVILDFGSQYTQLITKVIRKKKVYSVIHPYHSKLSDIQKEVTIKGVILSGGPSSVYDKNSFTVEDAFFDLKVPILGICYGMQLLAHKKGGKVEPSNHKEYGFAEVKFESESPLLKGVDKTSQVWMSHADHIVEIPKGFKALGRTQYCLSAMSDEANSLYALQFHPEVKHSQQGDKMIENFVFDICKMKAEWTMASFIDESAKEVRAQVGSKNVVLGLSGGVDSMTLAFLLEKAIGKQLTCIFVNNGLLRWKEEEEVQNEMKQHPSINFIYKDATDVFMKALSGVTDPEEKRKKIGKVFLDVFNETAKGFEFLAQGTLYTDVIESVQVKGPSDTIKTHHNRVKEVLELMEKGLIVEPFKELFKDEVREIAKELRMPEHLIRRQPFPGPGLAIRILGEVTRERLETLKKADRIFLEEVRNHGLYEKLWQSFAVLLPIKSVGVVGDNRTYGYTIVLRAVTSDDGMTADFAYLPKDLLTKVSTRIIGEIDEVARVAMDITSKPPATIEWE